MSEKPRPGMRPRKATCGRAARRISSSSDTTAASITPLRIPSSSTPTNATIETPNSNRLTRHRCRSSRDVDQALDGDEHDRREHHVRQVAQQPRQEEQAQRDRERGEHQRERRLRAGLVVHGRLRQAAGDRIALAERGGQVRRAEPEQLLARIDLVAVLLRQRAGGGDALDVREQEARERERDDAVHVAQPQRRRAEVGQASRQLADDREAEAAERRDRHRDDGKHHDGERDRPARQQLLAREEQGERGEPEARARRGWCREAGRRGRRCARRSAPRRPSRRTASAAGSSRWSAPRPP